MEPRFQHRKEQLLADCQVPPTLLQGVIGRLEDFAMPFAASLPSPESRSHTRTYLAGLLSDVRRKNAEAIAYRYDLDRQVIQRFVGKVENCQVGVFLGYVSDAEHALVDFRLYLPKEWASDRKRRKRAGIPKEIEYRTRHELALEMLQSRGGSLPHDWVAGDDEMGRPAWFRKRLATDGERYLLAVPSNTSIRDLEAEPPPYGGHGRRPKVPFRGVRAWCEAQPA